MSPHDPTDRPDDDLRRLLDDAVSGVEPGNGLTTIRSRTKESTVSTRPWIWGVGGAVVATAATITAVALAGNIGTERADDPGPAATPSGQASESTDPEPDVDTPVPSEDPSEVPAQTRTVPVYYTGDTPQGIRLYREFQEVEGSPDDMTAAATASVSGSPLDPDYRTLWPAGVTVASVAYDGDVAEVDLEGAPRERPADMDEVQAGMAVEQLVYSVQAGLGEGRVPVRLLIDGERSDRVLGVPTSEPLANGEELFTLALVSVTTPEQGASVTGEFEASGVASSFEATVPWEIRRGEEVVAEGFATAEGWMDKLYPWTTTVDVSGLAPGEYTFVATTSDPSGGAEGAGPHVDTKPITVE